MWLYPMLRVETYLTPARLSASRVEFVTGVLWPMLMHRFPDASSMLASDTGAPVIVGTTPKRDAASRNAAASSGPHPYTVIPMLGTAEENADATSRARRAADRAGSLEVMPSSQGSRVLPARIRFSIRRRYVAGRSARQHVIVHRRPPRHLGMIPLSLGEMLELGDDSEAEHRAVGEYAASRADVVAVAGEAARPLADGGGERAVALPDNDAAVDWLRGYLVAGDVVLVKASREARLDEVAAALS